MSHEFARKCLYLLIGVGLCACHASQTDEDTGDNIQEVVTPVKVAAVHIGSIADQISLNAVATYLKKNNLKANVNGYLVSVQASLGLPVKAGQPLFVIQTKEARAVDVLADSLPAGLLPYRNNVVIRASQNGFVSQLYHQTGDYVTDGEPLCDISDQNSFAFLLQVPFEWASDVHPGQHCALQLPDGSTLAAQVAYQMPMVDPNAQTQQFVLKVHNSRNLPENLVARATLVRHVYPHALLLPRTAILTNEEQNSFWVMKVINDSTAVRVPVQPGIQQDSVVQVVSPLFHPGDRVVTVGNYGLPDTARIRIIP
ncbi:multidrug efflux pump subunit AcrA (membrane-fusion protein) [Thermoflavifilum aggregans]|uniref:Multidrug efflux pump subunit AcrA (Membrane-fusion protein) n=1 Tax=Thermoflavifilum aggregans TaxID=454188 RepID=A0A2M9CTT7_9BACT|nr:HlyD family efflux transporter periplasmic adaptor subunit [Thermoflavifilum aggregans]PJJ75334.1 multidrug efflux pump subunit AcrA (membrane-fusion protein) [Thermoflavifilum aggregans]